MPLEPGSRVGAFEVLPSPSRPPDTPASSPGQTAAGFAAHPRALDKSPSFANVVKRAGAILKGERLGEFEELILLAVRAKAEDASGLGIQQALEEGAGRRAALGAIYAALDRLARKGMVTSWLGDPTPVRGGRRRRYYALTGVGLEQLEAARRVRDHLWKAGELHETR